MRAVALPVLVAVALTACSGGDRETTSARRAPATSTASTPATTPARQLQEYDVPAGSHPHDVAVANDGNVWYTAQATGKLGRLPEHLEVHGAHQVGELGELERNAQVGLVDTIARERLGMGESREWGRQVDAQHVAKHLADQAFH